MEANRIIKFLEGEWMCYNTLINSNSEVIKSDYLEKMVIKDEQTLEITAYGLRDGKDVTKDMTIQLVNEDAVTLKQDDFVATGKLVNNIVILENPDYQGKRFVMRLYLLNDIYVYEMDVYEHEAIVQTQMSYLERKQ